MTCPKCDGKGYVIVRQRNYATLSPSDDNYVEKRCDYLECDAEPDEDHEDGQVVGSVYG